jgi:DNA-binding transcriptional regulator YiaG
MKEYHYTECGLDNIYLVNGFTIKKLENGEESIRIHDIHKLHYVIGSMLVTKSGLLVGKEIQFIRRTMDLSQTALGKLLGVEYQSVLGWEKDKTAISKTADHFLKMIFFTYLEKDKDRAAYTMISKISSLDVNATQLTKKNKIELREKNHRWEAA